MSFGKGERTMSGKKFKKIIKKIINFLVKAITFASIIILFVFSCAVELETIGIIIYVSCIAWLGLMALIAWLENKGIIK